MLVSLGLALCLLSRVVAGVERHSYDPGAVAPVYVQVTAGHSYSIAVPSGVDDETDLGLLPSTLSCTISSTDATARTLTVLAGVRRHEGDRPDRLVRRAADRAGAHLVPGTAVGLRGRRRPNAGVDYGGLLLLIGVICLTIGVPLGLSALRTAFRPAAPV